MLSLKPIGHKVEQQLIEIVSAQASIAVAGKNFHYALLHLHNRDIERTATKVVNQQSFQLAQVGFVIQHSGGGFVDNPHLFQPGQFASLSRSFALLLVEKGWHGNHGLFHRLAE